MNELEAAAVYLLLLEDDPLDAELILKTLEVQGVTFEGARVDTREAFQAALEGGRPLDLILADYSVPHFDGPESLALARQLRPDVPFILISGKVGEEVAIDMLHAGATDYVLKQRLSRLGPAVSRALREKGLEKERQRAVNELAGVAARLAETALLEQVVSEMPAGVILYQVPSGRVLAMNRSAESLLDRARSELTTIADVARAEVYKPDGTRAGLEDMPSFRALTAGEVVRDVALELRHRDGARSSVQVSAAPIRDSAGSPLAVVVTYADVTTLKQTQEALREADRRKNEFLGVLSHELRNPLAPIRNAIHLLERAPEGTDQAWRARAVIARQTKQLARLVDDLLDVTRVARGKIRLHRDPTEVTELVRHAVEDHRPLFESRDIELGLRVDVGPQWIEGDAARITQIVGNLLQNAAKFTNAQGHVLVSVGRSAKARPEVVIRVSDDGIGIEAGLLARLFEPFTQAEESLHRTSGGLGLGLALVKGLAELHGGRVEVHSRGPGTGAEFTVSLPALQDVGLQQEPDVEPLTASRMRVLVIEDNLDAATTLQDVLEMAGHEVVVAHDGEEGVTKARSLAPDVVLCDVGLPGLDGYQVARRIRAERSVAPMLIAMTGYTLPEDQRQAYQAGFDHHLGKPVDVAELERVMAGATVRPGARRILVVEDNDALRENIKELLEEEGWVVREARDGREALEAVGGFDPALMLLDYRLPQMDGGEVLRQLGAIQAAPRVVLMTASSQVRELAAQHGLRFFVSKPFRQQELLDAVENARGGP